MTQVAEISHMPSLTTRSSRKHLKSFLTCLALIASSSFFAFLIISLLTNDGKTALELDRVAGNPRGVSSLQVDGIKRTTSGARLSNKYFSIVVPGKGIQNTGNICFASSVAQILFRIEGVRNFVLNSPDSAHIQTPIPALKSLFKSLEDPAIKTVTGHQGKFIPEQFAPGEQGDSEEFYTAWMAILENVMGDELKSQLLLQTRVNKTTKMANGTSETNFTTENDYIVKIPFPEVSIAQVGPLSFKSLLSASQGPFGDEILSENTIRTTRLTSLPKFAAFSFVRTAFVPPASVIKIKTPVQIPETLDLSPYILAPLKSANSTIYRFKMFVLHQGDGNGGHYVAYVRNSEDSWQLLDDASVTNVSNEEALKAAHVASLCFFERE